MGALRDYVPMGEVLLSLIYCRRFHFECCSARPSSSHQQAHVQLSLPEDLVEDSYSHLKRHDVRRFTTGRQRCMSGENTKRDGKGSLAHEEIAQHRKPENTFGDRGRA